MKPIAVIATIVAVITPTHAQFCNTASFLGEGLQHYTYGVSTQSTTCGFTIKAYSNRGKLDVSVCKTDDSGCWSSRGNFNPGPTGPWSCFDGSMTFSEGVQSAKVTVSCVGTCDYYVSIKHPASCGSAGSSKNSDGEYCSDGDDCSSGVCRGGNCCGVKGRSTGCTDCGSDGDCRSCSSGFKLSNYQCTKIVSGPSQLSSGSSGSSGSYKYSKQIDECPATSQECHCITGDVCGDGKSCSSVTGSCNGGGIRGCLDMNGNKENCEQCDSACDVTATVCSSSNGHCCGPTETCCGSAASASCCPMNSVCSNGRCYGEQTLTYSVDECFASSAQVKVTSLAAVISCVLSLAVFV